MRLPAHAFARGTAGRFALRVGCEFGGLRKSPGQGQRPALIQHKFGIRKQQVFRKRAEPAEQGPGLALANPVLRREADQARRILIISGERARGERMPDGQERQVIIFVPGRRPFLQRGFLPRLEPGFEELGEQAVVPVPFPARIEREEEDIGGLELLQHRLAAAAADHRVAQRRGKPVEDRRAAQKIAGLLREPLQDFNDEIIHHVAVIAAEGRQEFFPLGAFLPKGERRELQSGHPAFGPGFQRLHHLRRKGEVHRAGEEFRGFGEREPQIGLAQFGDLSERAEARQGQGRILARSEGEVQRRRDVLDQESHDFVDRGGRDEVVIVEDQHQRRDARQFI